MEWQEVSHGRFERPLDSVELLFRAIEGSDARAATRNWTVCVYARLSLDSRVEDAESALRSAWITMRYNHPQLACYVDGKLKKYDVPDDAAIDRWLARTYIIEVATTVDEVMALPHTLELPVLHYFPLTSEVLLCCSHVLTDAIGALALLDNLFEALVKPTDVTFGDEGKSLLPGRDTAAGLPVTAEETNEQAATKLLNEYAANFASTQFPKDFEYEIAGAPRRKEVKILRSTTEEIVVACKTKQLSVTTAVHAALVLALQRISPVDSRGRFYTSFGTFNYRSYLKPGYRDPASHPLGVYLVGLPIVIESSLFSDTASKLRDFYKQLSNDPQHADIRKLLVPYTMQCAAVFSQPRGPDMPQASEPLMDSLGVVDRYLNVDHGEGSVAITNFWIGSQTYSLQPLFYVWTWQGNMTFSVCYNEHYYLESSIEQLLERVRQELFEYLEIQDQSSVLVGDCTGRQPS